VDNKLICKICERECKNIIGLASHVRQAHKISPKDYFIQYLNNGIIPTCYCGKETKFVSLKEGFREFCSHRCVDNSSKVKEKREKTCFERFGSKTNLMNEEQKEKIKQTNNKIYGCDYPAQNKKVQEKMKETNNEKYGSDWGLQNEEVREKIKKTNNEKFGCDNPLGNEEVREKRKETMILRYGEEVPLKNKEIREQLKQTCLERFGEESPLKSKEVREKINETVLNYYGETHYTKSERYKEKQRLKFYKILINSDRLNHEIIPLFSEDEYKGADITNKYLWKCIKCNNIFEAHIDNGKVPRCKICYPHVKSYLEKLVLQEVKTLLFTKFNKEFEIIENDRKILEGKEIDILIPELQISIEVNGDYWHSLEGVPETDRWKAETLITKGFKHLVIKEEEWKNSQQFILKKLETILKIKFEDYSKNLSYFTGFIL
jgi:hypothetical protein